MKPRILIPGLLLIILACQVIPTPPALLNATPPGVTPPAYPFPIAFNTPTAQFARTTTPDEIQQIVSPGVLQPFPDFLWNAPRPESPAVVIPSTIQDPAFNLPVLLTEVSNLAVADGLTNSQRATLARNGFLVIQSGEAQFSDIRNRVSLFRGQPYFLTSDAAIYAYQLCFDELLKALEVEYLSPKLAAATRLTLEEVLSYLPVIQDQYLLKDARLAAAYLAVGLRLLDPAAQPDLDPEIATQVQTQVEQILTAQEIQPLVLMPHLNEDFRVYHPTSQYFNNPESENFMRGLTWFRQIEFKLSDSDPRFTPSKAPLVITLALRRAGLQRVPAEQDWAAVNDTLNYIFGSGYDFDPRRYAAMMDQVYGPRVSILGIADEFNWLSFQGLIQAIPFSQSNYPFNPFLIESERNRSWRFLSNRVTTDEIIMQSLTAERIAKPSIQRPSPSGLDLMAAFGSPAAVEALEKTGAMDIPSFQQQLGSLQKSVQSLSQHQSNPTIFEAWMADLSAQLPARSGGYPHYMQNLSWDYKQLNTALGSWILRKHGTSLISREPEIAARQVLPASPAAPAFVEPDPLFFYHLADQAENLVAGLESIGLAGAPSDQPFDLSNASAGLLELAEHFRKLGAIAEKELQGIPLGQEDFNTIQSPLGAVERRALTGLVPGQQVMSQSQELPAVPMLSFIKVDQLNSLQTGLGFLNRVFVLVPLEGKLQIAQGGVFSYYEYFLPNEELMTDGRWRRVLSSTSNFKPPAWMDGLLSQEEGFPVDVTAFRIGDIYRIALEGGDLNIRESPSIGSQVFGQLDSGTFIEIIDGPVRSQGFTWWKLKTGLVGDQQVEGWAVQNPAWYVRAWGN